MNKIVVADSDALVALVLDKDSHHERSVLLASFLYKNNITVVFPSTVFPETIAFLDRAANQKEKAHQVSKQLSGGAFQIQYLEEKILSSACTIYASSKSKQNTFFDAIVVATAKSLDTNVIFSFDHWYTTLGFTLVGDLYL